jgi:hypothetical protein
VQTGRREVFRADKDVKFYKGPCKTTNFFSMFDPKPSGHTPVFKFVEQPY